MTVPTGVPAMLRVTVCPAGQPLPVTPVTPPGRAEGESRLTTPAPSPLLGGGGNEGDGEEAGKGEEAGEGDGAGEGVRLGVRPGADPGGDGPGAGRGVGLLGGPVGRGLTTGPPPATLTNSAVTVVSAPSTSAQPPVPEQAPDHPANRDPRAAVAVSVRLVSAGNVALQLAGQLIAASPDETAPTPSPTGDTTEGK